jgi:hypothetical protein
VLAGDWHHYNHYYLEEVRNPQDEKETPPVRLNLHLITAGGGGAFLHSTTDLREEVDMTWGVRPKQASPGLAPETASSTAEAMRRPRTRRYRGTAKMLACYPLSSTSMRLSLGNLAFPLRNWQFSAAIGCLYWIMTWQFHLVAKQNIPALNDKINNTTLSTVNSVSNELLLYAYCVASESIFYAVMLAGLWAGLAWYVTVSAKRSRTFKLAVRGAVGMLHTLIHLKAMFFLFLACLVVNKQLKNVDFLYPLEIILLGGIVGGFIFGAYWVIAGRLARMHTGDSFGALGIRDYKNFLRMKFEKDKLTIYPIGVDKLPGTKACRMDSNDPALDGHPLLKLNPLEPVLIEKEPIVIQR